ncbi:hypothetical protein Hanom_Chr09g00840891 [Helianthus anomalus]
MSFPSSTNSKISFFLVFHIGKCRAYYGNKIYVDYFLVRRIEEGFEGSWHSATMKRDIRFYNGCRLLIYTCSFCYQIYTVLQWLQTNLVVTFCDA